MMAKQWLLACDLPTTHRSPGRLSARGRRKQFLSGFISQGVPLSKAVRESKRGSLQKWRAVPGEV